MIPGHGRICDEADVVEYRDMVVIIRDRVRDLKRQGLTLEQVKAASPARGYTRRYGGKADAATNEDWWWMVDGMTHGPADKATIHA